MKELRGKVAAVTGAASGLGRAMALAFAEEGMHVALADLDLERLLAVEDAVRAKGVRAFSTRLDVSNAAQVDAWAERVPEALGGVHVVCNNAGVVLAGPVWEYAADEWEWILGVNVRGVANGLRAFTPRLLAQGEGHIVNTASVAGLISPSGLGAYAATKHAVVALSEALHHDLQARQANVGVSVLCPAYVPTAIADPGRNPAPASIAKSKDRLLHEARLRRAVEAGKLSAADVARAVLEAVKENRFYVLTHAAIKGAIRARFEDVLEERAPRDPMKLR